ncbi:MAG: DegV family protein [Oscillospiraceae bacterium]|nr:DegV family protein [Oscillospiraceae bacterium]
MSFTILTDTSANLPKAYLQRNAIRTVPYTFMIDGRELEEAPDFEGPRFYSDMRRGKIVTTSQIPPQRYIDFFRSELEQGRDVLFVSMSSGISGSYHSACIAAEELRTEFPERKLRLVDALGASLGEGLLVVWAVRYRRSGLSVDEAADRLLERRYGMCQVFTVDDLRYLKRGGRLSNLAAAVGTVLQIKPLLKGDNEGKIVCFDKLRGRRRAIEAMAERFNTFALPQPGQTIGIAHADCEADMDYLISLLRRMREGLDIMTVCYEPVTGSHVGPGTLALFFEGSKAFR